MPTKNLPPVQERSICFAVTGGIAIYKSLDIISKLRKSEYDVQVMMTKNAMELVSPHTFAAISNNPVLTDQFDKDEPFPHLDLVQRAECFVICPATFNSIGKIASGIADDLITTTAAAAFRRRIIAPAMNVFMYENPILQQNLSVLRELGWEQIPPEIGKLACGYEGKGRLASVDKIVHILTHPPKLDTPLNQIPILVTAGATIEPLDPVRFISNYSSGKMGVGICKAGLDLGAKVTLIHGRMEVPPPKGTRSIRVDTAEQMLNAVQAEMDTHKVLIMAAAVSDYKPQYTAEQKIKKDADKISLELIKNPDIIKTIRAHYSKKNSMKNSTNTIHKPKKIIVGFAAETEQLLSHAQKKLMDKEVDMLVANLVTEEGSQFGSDTNKVTILFPDKDPIHLPMQSKYDVGKALLLEIRKKIVGT